MAGAGEPRCNHVWVATGLRRPVLPDDGPGVAAVAGRAGQDEPSRSRPRQCDGERVAWGPRWAVQRTCTRGTSAGATILGSDIGCVILLVVCPALGW